MRKTSPTAAERARVRIGENFRRQRGARTQEDIERGHGIAQSTISRLERGEYRALTIDLLLKLCVAYDCNPSDVLQGLDDAAVIARYEAA